MYVYPRLFRNLSSADTTISTYQTQYTLTYTLTLHYQMIIIFQSPLSLPFLRVGKRHELASYSYIPPMMIYQIKSINFTCLNAIWVESIEDSSSCIELTDQYVLDIVASFPIHYIMRC